MRTYELESSLPWADIVGPYPFGSSITCSARVGRQHDAWVTGINRAGVEQTDLS